MRIHADIGPIVIRGKGRFKPVGPIYIRGKDHFKPEGRSRISGPDHGVVAARRERTGTRLLAARFLVGFNVNGKPHWTEEDLIRLFVEIRETQARSAGATFLSQRGIWQPFGGRREPDEQGAQIVIMNEDELDEKTFTDEMVFLGEQLARAMDQDAIYLDIQRSGLVIASFSLTQDEE